MKKTSILAVMLLAACQPSTAPDAGVKSAADSAPQVTVFNVPASDDVQALDLTKLPEGFPILAEMQSAAKPAGCALSKANRLDGKTYNDRYVFTALEGGLYRVGINGALRTLRETQNADASGKVVRYFKTVDGEEIEIQVSLEASEQGHKGSVGRVKGWDEGFPLMCGYNRIDVTGDCDL